MKLAYLPLKLCLGLWLFSITLFLLFFPSELKPNLGRTVSYFVTAVIVFSCGYVLAMRRRKKLVIPSNLPDATPTRLIAVSAVFMIAASLLLLEAISVDSLGRIFESTSNLGDAYSRRKAIQAEGAGTLGTTVVTLFFFLYPFAVPLGIIYWQDLGRKVKFLVVLAALAYASYFLAGGTMKGFGDLAVLIILGFLVRFARSGNLRIVRIRSFASGLVGTALVVLIAFVIVAAFAARRDARPASLPIFYPDSFLGQLLGPYWAAGFDTAVAYYSKGFVGLGYSLDYREAGGLLSGFRALSDLSVRYLGFETQYDGALPFAMEMGTGYSATVNWLTVFPWWASSFNWGGAILFFGILGYVAAAFWFNATVLKDNLSVGIFAFILVILFFVPANNQVFMSSSSTSGFLVLLVFYLLRQFGLVPGVEPLRHDYALGRTNAQSDAAHVRSALG